jgi:hypothetical protein
MSAHAAHSDANQVHTIMGVIGTMGTADTRGTALPLPFSVDDATGAAYVKAIDQLPINTSNPVKYLVYDGSGLLGTIQQVIGGVTYSKSLSYDANGLLGTVSAWS